MNHTPTATRDLHWRLKVIENCLARIGWIDVCEEFVHNTAFSVLSSLNWGLVNPGHLFWRTLYEQLALGTPDFALIQAARRRTERLIERA